MGDLVIDLLNNNYDAEHGVVNVRPVVDALTKSVSDPLDELWAKFRSEKRWHSPILEAMRLLAATGRCNERGAGEILDATDTVAQEAGNDEYFKTINALAVSAKTAPTLTKSLDRWLKSGKDFERRLAFYAAGMLLEHNGSRYLNGVQDAVKSAADAETSPERRRDYMELMSSLRQTR